MKTPPASISFSWLTSPKVWLAVAFVAALRLPASVWSGDWTFVSAEDATAWANGTLVVVLASSLAAMDASRLHLQRFKTTLAYGPVGLFAVCAILWPITPLWYLIVRVRLTLGQLSLRPEFEPVHQVTRIENAEAKP